MDFFEHIARRILEDQGYWTRVSVRANLTRHQKRQLGKPSLPRPEVDVIAFSPETRELIFFEIKSYLDSPGVPVDALAYTTKWEGNRYKLLTLRKYARMVTQAILKEYRAKGLLSGRVKVRFGLVAGKIKKGEDARLRQIALKNKWVYLGPADIHKAVSGYADLDYENDPIVLTCKILNRS